MTVPTFPNVPVAIGVPPVNRAGPNDPGVPPLTAGNSASRPPASSSPVWGIFDDTGAVAILADSIVSVERVREFRISTFPVEQGGFASYDKVATPSDMRVVLTRGGTSDARAKFLSDLDALIFSTKLYTVVCPEVSYPSVSIVRYDYTRSSSNGVTLLTAEVHLTEVRVSATQTFSNSKSPTASDAVNDGSVQTKPPTSAQTPPAKPGPR